MKFNKKGYMLVEIIVASFIAFGIAYFILNMTIKLKNKNDDLLVETQVRTDQSIITNKLRGYMMEEAEEFDCSKLTVDTNTNTIKYRDNIIDVVNEYAQVEIAECNPRPSDREISIIIHLNVPQQQDNYDVEINYKYKPNPFYKITYDYNYNLLNFGEGETQSVGYFFDSNILTLSGTWDTDNLEFKDSSQIDFVVGNKYKLYLDHVGGNYSENNLKLVLQPKNETGNVGDYAINVNLPNVSEKKSDIFVVPNDVITANSFGVNASKGNISAEFNNYQVNVFLSQVVETMQEYNRPYDFSNILINRKGYRFNGWWTEREGGERITSESVMKHTGDQTLYAHWEHTDEIQYTVYHCVYLGSNYYNCRDMVAYGYGDAGEVLTLSELTKYNGEPVQGHHYLEGFVDLGAATNRNTKPKTGAVTETTILADGSRKIFLFYRSNYLYIQYHTDGGTLKSSNSSYGVNDDSLVTYTGNENGGDKFIRGLYGSTVNSVNLVTYKSDTDGLHNCNNSDAINIVKSGYGVTSGYEWISENGITYSQKKSTYKANEMASDNGCNLALSDCVVLLKVNWVEKSSSGGGGGGVGGECTGSDGTCTDSSGKTYGISCGGSWNGWTSCSGGKKLHKCTGSCYNPCKNSNYSKTWYAESKTCTTTTSGGGCFLAGTKVITSNGYKDIDKIEIGDYVLSYNENTGYNEYKIVLNKYIHYNILDNLYTLTIDDGYKLKVTSKHRFYIIDGNNSSWKAAEDLKLGDIVKYIDGSYHRITDISYISQTDTVYNLNVADNHNYYVGDTGILVHNMKVEGAW